MKSITLLKTRLGILALSCFSITVLFACVDEDARSDLDPTLPTNQAQGGDFGDQGGDSNQGLNFPVFDDGVLAFPGAEGYGKKATGARAGEGREIYHVTNLNDSGAGSFRDAVSKPWRIIVFDVSGVIKLSNNPIVFKSNQTILGHTAPGDGIVLYNGRISASGAQNLIVRFLRMRMGAAYRGDKDACGIANGSNMIFDHCSITWGKDENFSVSSDGKGAELKDITIQNSIIGQGLQNHSCGGLMQTDITNGVTIFRNLYIDNKTRNPKVKGLNQFVNNVVYNWGSGAAYNMSGDSKGPSETTIENNYFIVGPCKNWQNAQQPDGSYAAELTPMSPAKPFTGANELFNTYCTGNFYDNDKDGTLNGFEITQENWTQYCSGSPTFLAVRSELHPIIRSQQSARESYEWIVNKVGASLPVRDEVDAYLIDELTSLGIKGTIIQDERKVEQFPIGGPGNINVGQKTLDSDNDGMPDDFEEAWELDKNNPADAVIIAKNGYMNIENYVLSLEYPDEYEYELNKKKQ